MGSNPRRIDARVGQFNTGTVHRFECRGEVEKEGERLLAKIVKAEGTFEQSPLPVGWV
jgi:hypothetical protein